MADLEWDRNFALEQSGDDEEMLAELLVLFRDSSASDLARINDGLAAENAVAVADAAHSIKGASASLGVEGVRKIAAELEKKGRAGIFPREESLPPSLPPFSRPLPNGNENDQGGKTTCCRDKIFPEFLWLNHAQRQRDTSKIHRAENAPACGDQGDPTGQ
ncbi:MAG: Hpt domain-containing protein [Desulfurivibrionaceae bacterium]